MLKLLHIENIAVIERCDIEFQRGFNVLTGETGAGKSILIDAIGAVLGSRTTRDIVRSGEKKACVSAVFEDCTDEACDWLSENGYTDSGDSERTVIIQREILADGKSSARINGRPVTAAMLKSFGILLINILGQHDSQQLLNPESHPVFIDRFCAGKEYDSCFEKYKAVYSELVQKLSERKKLDIDDAMKARQIEMLNFQIDELYSADLKENEDEELTERRRIIRSSAKITERVSNAYSAFFGTDDSMGICSALSIALKALASVSDISDNLSRLSDRVSELYYSAEDISAEIRSVLDSLDFSQSDADAIEARLDTIHKLKRKYGNSVSEMLEYLKKAEEELKQIEFSDELTAQLDTEINALSDEAYSLAETLFKIRKGAANRFETQIQKELAELDMPNAKFTADIKKRDILDMRGIDNIEFLLAPNLGEAQKPLERIASGGELSRIMLAMKNVLAENDYVNTLIFDEIDTGVSGRAAQKIAEKLYKLSLSKQVICVTHLAQISAMSDMHFKIEKTEHDGRTYTNVTSLDRKGRADELARITGGMTISETTLKNASEMLDFADEMKRKLSI